MKVLPSLSHLGSRFSFFLKKKNSHPLLRLTCCMVLQSNVDAAAKKIREKGIEVMGVVCHVSNPQHRKNLVDITVEVSMHHLDSSSSSCF